MSDRSPRRSLSSLAARGAAVTLGGQGVRVAIQVIGLLVLTRLLEPEDYGLIAMVTAIIGIAEVFRDFGLTNAVVQAKSISEAQRGNLFWLNTGIGAILTTIVFFSAPLIGFLYDDARIVDITRALSITFLINGVATQYRAMLNRQMKFGGLAATDVGGAGVGLVLGVCFALLDFGYWSLVIQQLAYALVALCIAAFLGRWIPGWISRGAAIGSFVRFGANLVVAQVVTYAGRNVDSIVVGSALGARALGFYNRSYQFILLPLNQINAPASRVAVPVLSRIRDDKARYDAFILRGQTVLLHGVVALYGFAAAIASPLIYILLGEPWIGMVPIFQILSIAGVARVASYPTYWVSLSKGLPQLSMIISLISAPLLIAGSVLGAVLGGVIGVALAVSLVTLFLWPLTLFVYSRRSDAPIGALFLNGLQAICGYGIAAAGGYFTVLACETLPTFAQLGAGASAYILCLLLICLLWPGFRRALLSALAVARLAATRG